MSTSEAQVIAQALFDSVMSRTLQALSTAADTLQGASDTGASAQQVVNALPADAPQEVRNVLVTLANMNSLHRLPQVVQSFERFMARGPQESLDAEVVSAVELSSEQQNHVASSLRERYGNGLDVRFTIDPSLIGGLIIRVGDQVLDNSLRARLSAVQRTMQSS